MKVPRSPSQRGQILPLFALFIVVLLGFAALAIDVSGALSARRFYRSVADGASLAGAQDLQQTGSRAVAAADRIRARQHAMNSVVTELGITGTLPSPACDRPVAPVFPARAGYALASLHLSRSSRAPR